MENAITCPCGGAGHGPQVRVLRIPGTFKACVHHVFCLGGCNREGIGMTKGQAVERWNATFQDKIAA